VLLYQAQFHKVTGVLLGLVELSSLQNAYRNFWLKILDWMLQRLIVAFDHIVAYDLIVAFDHIIAYDQIVKILMTKLLIMT
jgi:hypothetical protein